MPDVIQNNPAQFVAALRAIAMAVLTLLVAFGLPVTPEQRDAIIELGGSLTTMALLFSVATVKLTVPKNPTATAPAAAIQNLPPLPPAPPTPTPAPPAP